MDINVWKVLTHPYLHRKPQMTHTHSDSMRMIPSNRCVQRISEIGFSFEALQDDRTVEESSINKQPKSQEPGQLTLRFLDSSPRYRSRSDQKRWDFGVDRGVFTKSESVYMRFVCVTARLVLVAPCFLCLRGENPILMARSARMRHRSMTQSKVICQCHGCLR
jgi:hypothetical protein